MLNVECSVLYLNDIASDNQQTGAVVPTEHVIAPGEDANRK
jgi:hypothetical protein